MVQQIHPDYKIKRLALHWIDHDNNEKFIECEYLKTEVERLLSHYKKQLKIKEELDKDKPFVK